MTAIHVLLSLLAGYVILSWLEYTGHRWLMHKMRIAKVLRSNWLKRLCHNHMALHHGKPYQHERSNHYEGGDDPLQLTITSLVAGLVIAWPIHHFIDHLTVDMLMVLGPLYAVTNYLVHKEMHVARRPFWARTALYRYLEHKHQLHHAHPNTEFNVILPLFDFVFRTSAPAGGIRLRHDRKPMSR
jgi:hypothetical protein